MTIDMSAKAITNRLKLVAQLRKLCLALGKARPVGSAAEPGPAVIGDAIRRLEWTGSSPPRAWDSDLLALEAVVQPRLSPHVRGDSAISRSAELKLATSADKTHVDRPATTEDEFRPSIRHLRPDQSQNPSPSRSHVLIGPEVVSARLSAKSLARPGRWQRPRCSPGASTAARPDTWRGPRPPSRLREVERAGQVRRRAIPAAERLPVPSDAR